MRATSASHAGSSAIACAVCARTRPSFFAHAVAYQTGPANSNQCPASSERIVTEAACKTAAAAAGKSWKQISYNAFYPAGCYIYSLAPETYVILNTHETGAASRYAQLLCATKAISAPSSHPHRGRPLHTDLPAHLLERMPATPDRLACILLCPHPACICDLLTQRGCLDVCYRLAGFGSGRCVRSGSFGFASHAGRQDRARGQVDRCFWNCALWSAHSD